jgi:hypothetical protein
LTPTVPELLLGNMLCLVDPPPEENLGDFFAARVGVTGMISMLCAQEAEKGIEARVWENHAIREVLTNGSLRHGADFAAAAGTYEEDLTLTALDRENAGLRKALIALHIAAEESGDTALHHEILRLYIQMADARRLDLPASPAG